MKVFEYTEPGFIGDGNHDEKVKWLAAFDLEMAKLFLNKNAIAFESLEDISNDYFSVNIYPQGVDTKALMSLDDIRALRDIKSIEYRTELLKYYVQTEYDFSEEQSNRIVEFTMSQTLYLVTTLNVIDEFAMFAQSLLE